MTRVHGDGRPKGTPRDYGARKELRLWNKAVMAGVRREVKRTLLATRLKVEKRYT